MKEKGRRQKEVKRAIDALVDGLVEELKENLSHCLGGITLVGSYVTGKVSLERPNVNLLIFVKSNIRADDYLKLGEIFYTVSKKFLSYFSIKIDSLPFRAGFPIGDKELQLVLTPNILSIIQRNDNSPFGIPLNVLEGMKTRRKVVFGRDLLKDINTNYTRKDLIQWAIFDIGVLFRNQLLRSPLTYDVDKYFDILADEALEIGKIALMWGTEIFLNKKDWKAKKYLELISDKEKLVDFYQDVDKELGEAAKVILEARNSFFEYKKNKDKAIKLYNAAYTAVDKVFLKILEEMEKE